MGFVLVGHRGFPAEITENTVESLAAAQSLGVDQIETDVRISQDGVLFLLHDATLDRTMAPGGPVLGPVADLPFAAIRAVELRGGLRVPTLAELYASTELPIELEIKAPEAVPALAEFLLAHPEAARRTTLTSFVVAALQEVAELVPELARMVIVSRFSQAAEQPGGAERWIAEATASGIATGFEGLTREAVDSLHRAGIRVHVWPVKDSEAMARAAELDADGGTSDFARDAVGWARDVGLR